MLLGEGSGEQFVVIALGAQILGDGGELFLRRLQIFASHGCVDGLTITTIGGQDVIEDETLSWIVVGNGARTLVDITSDA
jgi:hypothetical protein